MLFFVCSLYRKNNRRFERRNKKSSDKINLADARRNLGCTEMKSRVARLLLVIIWGEYRFGIHRRLSILNLRYVSRRARACSRRVQFLTIVLASPGGRGSAAGSGEGVFFIYYPSFVGYRLHIRSAAAATLLSLRDISPNRGIYPRGEGKDIDKFPRFSGKVARSAERGASAA